MSTKQSNPTNKGLSQTKRRVAIAILLVLVAFGAWHYARVTAPFRGESGVWIKIPGNASMQQVKDSIMASLGDNFGGAVAMLWSGDLDSAPGAYYIEPGERAWKVARRISRGMQNPVKVTFNNVRTINELADKLAGKLDFTPEDFLLALKNIENSDSVSREDMAVQFLPDTYEAYWNTTPEAFIRTMQRHYASVWNESRREKAASLGLTPRQVSILASIVEEETNKIDERGSVARLYLNRLKKGMLLQADPTAKFASGDFSARRITAEMLSLDSPYNTYKYPGLPPGIIRMPELRTIDAVLNAPVHDYIYMCAKADLSGYHTFTSSYDTHKANARAFREAAYKK